MVKVKKVTRQVAKKSVAAVKNEINKVKKTAKLGKVKNTAKETTRKVKQQLKLQTKQQKREIKLKKVCEERGVVYIKHIPHGFYEKEMYDYFRQFGKVTAIKLPRSKNGKSKGFAFIEFEYKEIAKVVADTMNNYLMFDQMLKTEYIPPEQQKPHFFHRNSMPWDDSTNKDAADQRRELDRINKNKPALDHLAFVRKTARTVRKLHSNLLKKTGIDYEFQVNEPPVNEKVQLLSVKRESRDVLPINDVKATRTMPKRRKLINKSLNETDANLRIKPPPNKVTKFLKSSKSKLKTVKNKADAVKIKLKTEAKANKKVKELKSKVKNAKNKAKNVIKNGKSSIGKNKTNSKVNNKTKSNVKNGKFTKKVVNKSTKKVK